MDSIDDPHIAERAWRPATRLVRGGCRRSPHGETSEALYLNSGFVYDDAEQAEARFKGEAPGFIYSRYGNPTVAMFERRMALLEGAEAAFATASGMAAVFASMMCQLKAGDRVVASRALFGSCSYIITQLLPRYGMETVLVDGPDLEQWRAALAPGAACVFFETPANPTLELINIAAVSELSHAAGAKVIVDNVFSTPLLQRPLDLGADIVVYSGTKHIDGQGRCLGGVVVGSEEFRGGVLEPFMRHTGPCLSPFNAWVLLKGLETLDVRVERPWPAPDVRRQYVGQLRSGGRQAGRVPLHEPAHLGGYFQQSGRFEKPDHPPRHHHPPHAVFGRPRPRRRHRRPGPPLGRPRGRRRPGRRPASGPRRDLSGRAARDAATRVTFPPSFAGLTRESMNTDRGSWAWMAGSCPLLSGLIFEISDESLGPCRCRCRHGRRDANRGTRDLKPPPPNAGEGEKSGASPPLIPVSIE